MIRINFLQDLFDTSLFRVTPFRPAESLADDCIECDIF